MITEQEWKEAEKKVLARAAQAKSEMDWRLCSTMAGRAIGNPATEFDPVAATTRIMALLRMHWGKAPRYCVQWDLHALADFAFSDSLEEAKKVARMRSFPAIVARTAVMMLIPWGIPGDDSEYWRKPAGQPC